MTKQEPIIISCKAKMEASMIGQLVEKAMADLYGTDPPEGSFKLVAADTFRTTCAYLDNIVRNDTAGIIKVSDAMTMTLAYLGGYQDGFKNGVENYRKRTAMDGPASKWGSI
ncbi:MAG TPA: hypothetical protein DCX22_01965 [Dehalococcoidia bacterium]|nr:hypothetical protein [Dehalococcoidia bacterium]